MCWCSDGAYVAPVAPLSFQQARQRFLRLIRRNPPQQQKLPDDDVDMLVPDGGSMLHFGTTCVCLFCMSIETVHTAE